MLDATTGQNGLIQARQFKETAGLTGIVLTKLDGTAKGGIVVAIAQELQVPVKFVGVGEGIGGPAALRRQRHLPRRCCNRKARMDMATSRRTEIATSCGPWRSPRALRNSRRAACSSAAAIRRCCATPRVEERAPPHVRPRATAGSRRSTPCCPGPTGSAAAGTSTS